MQATTLTYFRCPSCNSSDNPTSTILPDRCIACERAALRHGDPPIDIPDEPQPPTPGGPPPPDWACITCNTADYPPSSRLSGACVACANAWYFGLKNRFDAAAHMAVSLQSQAIDARIKRCVNCDGPHFSWACPEIGDAVTAVAVYDTAEMVRLWGASRTLLATKLARLSESQLLCQAMDFAAWLNQRTHANLPARSVLTIWEQMIDEHWRRGPALRQAA